MIDLGAWASEAYRVPVEAPSDEDEGQVDESPSRPRREA